MKILVARCAALNDPHGRLEERVSQFLQRNGFKVQPLHLPPLHPPDELIALTSYRLLPIADMADALLCLDLPSAVLKLPRKLVWIHDGVAAGDAVPTFPFAANVVRAGVKEASAFFAPKGQTKQLRALGLTGAKELGADPGRSSKIPAWAPVLEALRS